MQARPQLVAFADNQGLRRGCLSGALIELTVFAGVIVVVLAWLSVVG